MVDKPHGKTEVLLDGIFEFFKSKSEFVKDKTSPQRKGVEKFKGKHPRIFKTGLIATIVLAIGLVVVGFATPKTVTVNVTDFNETVTRSFETTSLRVDSFIENHEIDFVYGQDIIDVQLYKGIYDGMEINIKKAALIPVTADGKTINAITQPVTVKELLDKLEIKVEAAVVKVTISNISYVYNLTDEPQRLTAEEWITDEEAISRKGKLYRVSGKFRVKTIDLQKQLFDEIAEVVAK